MKIQLKNAIQLETGARDTSNRQQDWNYIDIVQVNCKPIG